VFHVRRGDPAALKQAGALANRLGGNITLIGAAGSAFPATARKPPVLLDWKRASLSGHREPESGGHDGSLYLCRDRARDTDVGAEAALSGRGRRPKETVVPTSEEGLAKMLRRAGP